MSTTRRSHLTCDSERSPFISERRRKLFPTEDHDMDSDLGVITPISVDELRVHTPTTRRASSESNSPLLTPCHTFSHEENLKTPRDTSTKPVLEEQKILLEQSKSSKRATNSPGSSPETKPSDVKSSKVRTALFPPDNALSTKSFYSKNQEDFMEKLISMKKERICFRPLKASKAKQIRRPHRQLGQVNNGVGHNIKKPKQKKHVLHVKPSKLLETGSELNEYIQDIAQLRNKINTNSKLIQVVGAKADSVTETPKAVRSQISSSPKQIQTFGEENKENLNSKPRKRSACSVGTASSVVDNQPRKFFKTSRSKCALNKPHESATDNLLPHEAASKSVDSILIESQPFTSPVIEDFSDNDCQVVANIDNIISVLSDENLAKKDGSTHVMINSQINEPSTSKAFESHQVVFNDNLMEDHNLAPIQRHQIDTETQKSITANSFQLQQNKVANMILSPISQMCNVTSGLAIHSPVKTRSVPQAVSSRVSKMLSFNSDYHSVDMEEQKKMLFPIFDKESAVRSQPMEERGQKRNRTDVFKRGIKRFKGLPPGQMLLDAGQKRFGITLCNECNLMYHMGDPNDEMRHLSYHNSEHILRFAGWKNERVIAEIEGKGRIIKVLPTDSKFWTAKVKSLMEVVVRDLGCYEMDYDLNQSQVYMYIKNRAIVGCVAVTVPKGPGYRMLSTISGVSMCSEESYPIKCGISLIWVAANSRQQGVGSALIDAVRRSFIFGQVLSNEDIALTSPTEAGSAFAQKYFNTPNYLIYYS